MIRALLIAALLSPVSLGAAASAHGQTRTIEVDVESMVQPATAVGLLISSRNTIQRPSSKIEKKGPNSIVVSFEASSSDLQPGTMASALIVSEKGEVVFGNVKPVIGVDSDQALGSLALCEGDPIPVASLVGQYSILEKIHAIRLKRRDQARATVSETLSGDFLVRLQKLERGFGLAREKELGPDLTAHELIDRLSRLRDALRNWEQRSEPTPTPVPLAPSELSESAQGLAGSAITAP